MSESVISIRAYCKIILHCLKYPHCSVNGLLLAEKGKKDQKSLHIVDSVPLFHVGIGLTPMMEIALAKIDQYCKSESLQIAGYYHANENFAENSPDIFASKVIEKIADYCNDAVLLLMDNRKLSPTCDQIAFSPYYWIDGKCKQKDKSNINVEDVEKTLSLTSALIQTKTHQQLSDFDNHLDDLENDWRNPAINKLIEAML